MVCKRWNELSSLSWEGTHTLRFDSDEGDSNRLIPTPLSGRTNTAIKRIVQRCGPHLRKLSVRECSGLLQIISRNCPNIELLNIDYHSTDWRGSVISENLRVLKILSYYKNLKIIKLNRFVLNDVIIDWISKIASLNTLQLMGCLMENRFLSFSSLKNLKHLSLLWGTKINNCILFSIIEHCTELRILKFCSSGVSDVGVSRLAPLTKLEELHIADWRDIITDRSLSALQQLIKLNCDGCQGIKDAGIIKLMKNAAQLKKLNLTNTGVTVRLLHAANIIMNQRTNNIELKLVVDEEVIGTWVIDKQSAQLVVMDAFEDDE